MFGELRLNRAMTDEQIEIMRDPLRAPTAKLPRIEDAVKAGGFLTGSADEIIEHLMKLEKAYPGLDRISISPSVGVPQVGDPGTGGTFRQGSDAGVQGAGHDERTRSGEVGSGATHLSRRTGSACGVEGVGPLDGQMAVLPAARV